MKNLDKFRTINRSLVIAPAGYGKTYAISECVAKNTKRSLILTHTNAGIASIKNKLREQKVQAKQFKLETISGFVERYVLSLSTSKNPHDINTSDYYNFYLTEATELLKIPIVQDVVRVNFNDLYVDEYQDCTKLQHLFIIQISNIIQVHILGDPLQAIFNFRNNPSIDWETDLQGFNLVERLDIPWRWQKSNPKLGNSLDKLRISLETEVKIKLSDYLDTSNILITKDIDINDVTSQYFKWVSNLIDRHSQILIIHPNSTNLEVRKKFLQKFGKRLDILESIDSKDFYKFSKILDESVNGELIKQLIYILKNIFKNKIINDWFNDNGVKNKRNDLEKETIKEVKLLIDELINEKNLQKISIVFELVNDLPNNICYRRELLNDIIRASKRAHDNNSSVYDSMAELRNVKRRTGRFIQGKKLGTTLLTKGLEFENVLVLDINKFKDKNNFYVAVTRATKNLYVVSEKDEVTFT